MEQSDEGRPVNGTTQLTDWQKKLLQKQQDVIQWAMQHNVVISPELVQLWDQAMSLGEEKGQRAYQDFLNQWQEFQKNPPKTPARQEPTKWQQQLLLKQQEVMTIAHKENITIPRELINLWEQAISSGEKDGQKAYDEFVKKWEDLVKSNEKAKEEPLAGQYVDRTFQNQDNRNNYQNNQGRTNNENHAYPSYNQGYGQPSNPYGQWQPNANRNYDPYNQGYPYQGQYPYQDYNQGYNRGYNQGYNPYQNQYQNPYQMPYQGQYREPFAGQQLTRWQMLLQDLQKEIIQWSQDNGIQVPREIIMYWESAMRDGSQTAYEQFLNIWAQYKQSAIQDNPPRPQPNPEPQPNPQPNPEPEPNPQPNPEPSPEPNPEPNPEPKPEPSPEPTPQPNPPSNGGGHNWKTALINQIEGQNIVAKMLGVNLENELTILKTEIHKVKDIDVNSVLNSLMDSWNKINGLIHHDSQADRRRR